VVHQVRLALGQVLEYRHRLQSTLSAPVRAVIVATVEAPPPLRRACGGAGVVIADRTTFREEIQALTDEAARRT
jgi:hypothetical protein